MMDYGPDWPSRPAAPCRPRRSDLVTYNMLLAALLMLGWLALWCSTAPLRLDIVPETPAATAGPPVAGDGQPSHTLQPPGG